MGDPVSARYTWLELSQPRTLAEKGDTGEYYDRPRTDLIELLQHAPRVVLEAGCGSGATGATLKQAYPQAVVHGVELSVEAAALAANRLDRVICANVEQVDFEESGFAHGSIDTVFFPDVLEHLYDPWNLLVRLRPYLSADAQVVASIPNSRNLWLLMHLLHGNWDYVEEGLLDVTHIRFFTLKTVRELFEQTGYTIVSLWQNPDGRIPDIPTNPGPVNTVDAGDAVLRNLSPVDVAELSTLQFRIVATPL